MGRRTSQDEVCRCADRIYVRDLDSSRRDSGKVRLVRPERPKALAELCQRHGLYLVARIGPWTHGEVRNGGFPDWLLKEGLTRRNDANYMAHVATFYAQVGAQLKGLLWKDGGSVIGIQLENEFSA